MKNIGLFLVGMLMISTIFVSCKKNEDTKGAPPLITRIALGTDQKGSISSSDINAWIIIHGQNLKTAQRVLFSDLEVNYESIYATDSTVSVKIPRSVPSVVTNKVTVETKFGTATYDLTLQTPMYTIRGIKNEHTPVGDTLEIVGDFLDLYFSEEGTTVAFHNGSPLAIADMNADRIRVVVPTGAQVGPLTIKGPPPLNSEYVTNHSWYKDNRNPLAISILNPANGLLHSDPDYPKNPAPFVIKKGAYAAWAWDEFFTALVEVPEAAKGAGRANYNLKFEIATKVAWTKGDIIFNLGAGNYYRWPFNATGMPLNTNGAWVTMTIPLNVVGDPSDGYAWFTLLHSDGEARELDFALSNFRIVPKN
jgi:hypothetical protein